VLKSIGTYKKDQNDFGEKLGAFNILIGFMFQKMIGRIIDKINI
jgi:hypothetical protein